ncbi:hypothetical protein [Microseira wollei]|nr:hypothetical protein [Microseira wollei]
MILAPAWVFPKWGLDKFSEYAAMRRDLEGLAITKKDLKRLTGVSVDEMKLSVKYKYVIILSVIVLLAFLVFSLILAFQINTTIFACWLLIVISLLSKLNSSGVERNMLKILLTKKPSEHLVNILKEVERYNAIVKAIDIKDRLEEAGNPAIGLSNRKQVIEALEITRSDLVRGLKTERILRENKSFIESNPEMFANNLIALTALQVSDQASEHGQILDEALQIAVSVQREMRKLESQR